MIGPSYVELRSFVDSILSLYSGLQSVGGKTPPVTWLALAIAMPPISMFVCCGVVQLYHARAFALEVT